MKSISSSLLSMLVLVYSSTVFGDFVVSSVTPQNSNLGNDATVTLEGSGFNEISELYFGSIKSPSFQIFSDSLLETQVPIPIGPFTHVHVKVGNGEVLSPVSFQNRYTFTNSYWLAYVSTGKTASQGGIVPYSISSNGPLPNPTFLDSFSYGLAISQNASRLYAVSSDYVSNHAIVVLDIPKNQVIQHITVPFPPVDMAINFSGTKGYVIYHDYLAEIDLLNSTLLTEINLPYIASQLIITPDSKKAYISHYYDNAISVIDLETKTILNSIAISRPYALTIHPDGNTIYVCLDRKIGCCIDVASDKVRAKFNLGFQPYSIAIHPAGKEAYVANFGSNKISVIDLTTNIETQEILVGNGPISIAVSPDGQRGYVANYLSGTMTTLDLTSHQVILDEPIGYYPSTIVITPDQSPVADFFISPPDEKLSVHFDASASFSPVGKIVQYSWQFGDDSTTRETLVTDQPCVTHTFSSPGSYFVTLTVTNSAGTSTTQLFTGKTMLRNGSYFAQKTKKVDIYSP